MAIRDGLGLVAQGVGGTGAAAYTTAQETIAFENAAFRREQRERQNQLRDFNIELAKQKYGDDWIANVHKIDLGNGDLDTRSGLHQRREALVDKAAELQRQNQGRGNINPFSYSTESGRALNKELSELKFDVATHNAQKVQYVKAKEKLDKDLALVTKGGYPAYDHEQSMSGLNAAMDETDVRKREKLLSSVLVPNKAKFDPYLIYKRLSGTDHTVTVPTATAGGSGLVGTSSLRSSPSYGRLPTAGGACWRCGMPLVQLKRTSSSRGSIYTEI